MAPHRRTDATRRSIVVATLAAVIAVVLGGTVDTAPLAHATPERCDGVWVVVDARVLGGPTTTRCVPTERPIRGIDALTRAGHTVSDVPGQPGFICRIDRRPDPCPGTPPPDAYWSYWLAEPGGTWRYSQFGAANREAAPGTVDAWAFGAGDPPSIAPPRPATEERPDRDDDDGSDPDGGSTAPRSQGPSTDADAGRSGGDASSDRDRSGRDDGGSDAAAAGDPDGETQAGTSGSGQGDDADAAAAERGPRDGDDSGDEGDDDAPDRPRAPSPDRVAGPIGEPSGTTDDLDDERADDPTERDADDRAAEGEVLLSRDDDGGSLVPVALGGGLLAGLAATAAWTSRRRAAALDPGT